MSNVDNVIMQWAQAVIRDLEPVKGLLALDNASEADLKRAAKDAHALAGNFSFFGVHLQRLFDLPAMEAHLAALVGRGKVETAPAPEPAPAAQETLKDEAVGTLEGAPKQDSPAEVPAEQPADLPKEEPTA